MKEIRAILADLGVPVLSMKEAGITAEIVEDGKTFEENADIKARTIMELTGDVVLADDSGLEIDWGTGNLFCPLYGRGYFLRYKEQPSDTASGRRAAGAADSAFCMCNFSGIPGWQDTPRAWDDRRDYRI